MNAVVDTRANLARERELHARLTPELRAEIKRRISRLVHDDDWAEDATQDALVQLWRQPEALCERNRGLLVTIVQRAAYRFLRSERRHAHEQLPDDEVTTDE